MSGPAAHGVATTLEQDPAIDLARADAAGAGSLDQSVVLHVLETSSAPNIAEEVERVRELSNAPLILAAYGEPNGIVETVSKSARLTSSRFRSRPRRSCSRSARPRWAPPDRAR